jgi:hypothetical protein
MAKRSAPLKGILRRKVAKPLTITILIPKELGLTQELVDQYKEKFVVEVAGTLGSTKPQQIVIQAVDAPSNDY